MSRWAYIRVGPERHLPEPSPSEPHLSVLAEALMALSPVVAPADDGVWVEIGRSAHLFGGEEEAAADGGRIAGRLGFCARVVVADGHLSARALARWLPLPSKPQDSGRVRPVVVSAGSDAAALGPLPVAALGASEGALAYLDRLGVRTADTLRRLPAAGMGQRLGREGEELVHLARGDPFPAPKSYKPREQPEATLELDPPVGAGEPLLFLAQRLLSDLVACVSGRGLAVACFEAEIALEGGACHRTEVMLQRPLRSARSLLALLRQRWEHSEVPDERASGMRIRVLRTARSQEAQNDLFDRREVGAEDLDDLIARLAVTLGEEAVFGVELVPSHRPEGAWAKTGFAPPPPVEGSAKEASAHDRPPRVPTHRTAGLRTGPGGWIGAGSRRKPEIATMPLPIPIAPRPVFLLEEPLEVNGEIAAGADIRWGEQRSRIREVFGPERLRGDWWTRPFHRDYFVVELEGEGRLWAYRDRVLRQWFVHGVFD